MSDQNEVVEYICGHCNGTTFTPLILHDHEDKATYLLLRCSNEKCVESREMLFQPEEKEGELPVSWGLFDITGQGYDPEDVEEENEKGLAN